MALTDRECEEVTEFVRRYCAVQTDGEGAEDREGRFAIEQGPSQRKAKKVRAPVKWGAFDRVFPEVLRRVRECAGNGEGHVFVAAYETGETSPVEVLRIAGAVDAMAEDDGPIEGGAIASLVSGNLRMLNQILAENREWRDRAFRGLDNALEERERTTMLAVHAAIAEQAGADQRMADALQALGPTIEAVMPRIVELVGRYAMGPGAAAPADLPPETDARLVALAARLYADATEMMRTATADPTAASRMPEASVNQLRELVATLAPVLGLRVEPIPRPSPDGAE